MKTSVIYGEVLFVGWEITPFVHTVLITSSSSCIQLNSCRKLTSHYLNELISKRNRALALNRKKCYLRKKTFIKVSSVCFFRRFRLLLVFYGGFSMFNVGDKIVYPMHGAGVIESIEEREILGLKQNYYVMKMPVGDMKVMIPTQSVNDIGIRQVIGTKEVEKVLAILGDQNSNVNNNWNKRYRENMVKIKSGNIFEVADVVRTLMLREKDKGLSTGERKMLNSARQILISELVLAKNTNPCEIEGIINDFLNL